MKHYSPISTFYKKNNCRIVNDINFSSIIDLIYSNGNQKFILYDDLLYNKILDTINLNWDDDQVLIIAPKNNYSALAPSGFNQYNQHTIDYLTMIYSTLKKDIRAIFCPQSQKNKKIKNITYNTFIINNNTQYESCMDFCKKNYQKQEVVCGINQYAARGGIIDIYPNICSRPKRVSFLKDFPEIRSFNVETQLSEDAIIKELKIPIKEQGAQNIYNTISIQNKSWEKITINQNSQLVMHKHTNNKLIQFPFKEINYNEYKSIHKKEHKVSYQDIQRMSGFLDVNNNIFLPSWFKKPKEKNPKKPIIDIAEINVGDYVIHREYGIGKFIGFKYISGKLSNQEFLIIQYADRSSIAIDISHLNHVTFYASGDNENIQLDSLTKRGLWKKRRNIAIKNVQNIVNKLLNLYINRENAYREPILPSKDEKTFISDFRYLETPDQLSCWEEIMNDLDRNTPMDRLICGDVGFGKTELAIRTAYRYAENNKKVLVLAPTTILCEQLYMSFSERLKKYYVLIDRVSRFRLKKETNNIKDRWLSNNLDIIIGTHAVLYDKIYLADTDLLIIDEEHRFGVAQKEKIKKINPGVDILTMSATPIPRTLNMALSGMKKISTLTTPPKYRKPIITNITYFNEKLIITAIRNEVFRNGQVYFVHNNVNTLTNIMFFLEKELTDFNIDYVHGQMDSKSIAEQMKKFTNKKIDVLVCTSIIENGIDLPNVNTIIINNAHKFGLSQLYQIRGRVGRSHKQAYAFLLIPNKIKLLSNARVRLETIEKYTNLGAGYKIANMDLTIRGGGAVFGYDQSGNIENIGYELVSKLINEYIQEKTDDILNVQINLIDKGIIPIEYINSEKLRLLIYRKIKALETLKELKYLKKELENRFGSIPVVTNKIFSIQTIHIISKTLFIHLIEEKEPYILIHFNRKFWEQRTDYLLNKINEFINQQSINYQLKEFKESLVLKLYKKETLNEIDLINQFMQKLSKNKRRI